MVCVPDHFKSRVFGIDTNVNGHYYNDVLLNQQILPVMSQIAGSMYMLQQDNKWNIVHSSHTSNSSSVTQTRKREVIDSVCLIAKSFYQQILMHIGAVKTVVANGKLGRF